MAVRDLGVLVEMNVGSMLNKLRGLGLEVIIRFNVSFPSFLWKLMKICFSLKHLNSFIQ